MTDHKLKLISYGKFASAFLLMHSDAVGQAVYTDLEPDVVLSEGDDYFALDMDDLGGYDFVFFNWTDTTYTFPFGYLSLERLWVGPYALNYAAVAGVSNYISTAGTRYYPYALSSNDPINEDLSFQNWFYQRMAFRTFKEDGTNWNNGGYWYPEVSDHYLGVRFIDSEDCLHYGWIRCDVADEGRTLIIKDYGYESKCDVGILAGNTIGDTTTVGIEENNILNATVYCFENTLNINLNELIGDLEVHVYDIAGKKVYSDRITNLLTQIKLTEPQGIYIVTLISSEGMFTRKIFIN